MSYVWGIYDPLLSRKVSQLSQKRQCRPKRKVDVCQVKFGVTMHNVRADPLHPSNVSCYQLHVIFAEQEIL